MTLNNSKDSMSFSQSSGSYLSAVYKRLKPADKTNYIEYHQRKSVNTFLIYALPLISVKFIEDYFINDTFHFTGCNSLFHIFAIVLGLATRQYKMLDAFLFTVFLCQPLQMKYTGTDIFAAPAQIIFSSMCYFTFTRRPFFSILHLICQTVSLWVYVVPEMQAAALTFTPEQFSAAIPGIALTTLKNGIIRFAFILLFYTFNQRVLNKLEYARKKIALKNEDLLMKTVQLEESLEERRMFILTFSHEFKNALNGLLGSLRVAMDQITDEETRDLLSTANACAYILRNFAHNVLDTGKLENKQLEIAMESTKSIPYLTNLWRLSAEMVKAKRLKGSMKISKNLPMWLKIDTQKLFQVIMNLTTNSVKFTKSGYINYVIEWEPINGNLTNRDHHGEDLPFIPRVYRGYTATDITLGSADFDEAIPENSIFIPKTFCNTGINGPKNVVLDFNKRSLTPFELQSFNKGVNQPGSHGYLKISIIDTGCGMTQENSEKLFRKFSQVSDEANDRKQGTGLGLWITKELVTLMGGDIYVKTKKDVGTTFEIKILTEVSESPSDLLTFTDDDNTSTQTLENKRRISRGPKLFKKNAKVLIADDDSFNVILLCTYIRKLGVETIVARDGQELLDEFKIHHEEVALIITDNNMPRMDGKNAVSEITNFLNNKNLKKIPIYLVTGDSEIEQRTNYRSLGITEVLAKPIDFDRINRIVIAAVSDIK